MQVSLAGFDVCAGLLLIGYCLHATLIVALMGSLAFGSTAIGTLTTLGRSSPLIFTFIAFILLLFVLIRRTTLSEPILVFTQYRAAWIALGLMLYACLSAVFLPRLFAGRTSAFVPIRGQVFEVPLGPVAAISLKPVTSSSACSHSWHSAFCSFASTICKRCAVDSSPGALCMRRWVCLILPVSVSEPETFLNRSAARPTRC